MLIHDRLFYDKVYFLISSAYYINIYCKGYGIGKSTASFIKQIQFLKFLLDEEEYSFIDNMFTYKQSETLKLPRRVEQK